MRVTYGNGGWIRVQDEGIPGWLYLKLDRDELGRWTTRDLYLDCSRPLTADVLRRLPLARVEAIAAQGEGADRLDRSTRRPGPQLDLMAQAFATRHIGHRPNCDKCGGLVDPRQGRPLDWLETSWWAQVDDVKVRRPTPPRQGLDQEPEEAAPAPPLVAPTEGLTERFLGTVRAAYDRAVRDGMAPAPTLAGQAGVPVRTVHRWVYLARQRGIMPAAAPGKAGGRS